MGNIKPLFMPHFGIWPRDTLGLPLWASDEQFSWLDVNFNAWGGRFTAKGYEVDGDLWPATGFVDTEIRGSMGLESRDATTKVQPRVHGFAAVPCRFSW